MVTTCAQPAAVHTILVVVWVMVAVHLVVPAGTTRSNRRDIEKSSQQIWIDVPPTHDCIQHCPHIPWHACSRLKNPTEQQADRCMPEQPDGRFFLHRCSWSTRGCICTPIGRVAGPVAAEAGAELTCSRCVALRTLSRTVTNLSGNARALEPRLRYGTVRYKARHTLQLRL